jgi:hypothetical protein
MVSKTEALFSLAPTAEWVATGDSIRWDSPDIVQPDDNAIADEAVRLNAAEPWTALRAERNQLLAATDWWALVDSPTMSDAQTVYRQALRDIPANTTDVANPTWPTKP